MSFQTFFENIHVLAESPQGIPNLRKMILHLAVRGRLGTQNTSDTPLKSLLETLDKQKAKSQNSFKQGKKVSLDAITEDERFCDVPSEWAWVRLNDLGRFTGGSTPSTTNTGYWEGNIIWVSPKDMKNGCVVGSELKITEKALQETRLELIPPHSILIVGRSGILKRLIPVAINEVECTVNQDLKVIVPFVKGISDYIQLMLKGFEEFILTQLVKGGMTVQSLKYSEFERQAFPIPPLEEQSRILNRVVQLSQICDQLQAQLKAKRQSRINLNTNALSPLKKAASLTPKEFEQATARIIRNFGMLYQCAETVRDLRSSILQLAVQGKLVPQSNSDWSAKELLAQLEIEKQRLNPQSRINKNTIRLTPVAENEQPYEVPPGWQWCRIGDFSLIRGGKRLPKGATFSRAPTERVYIQVTNMKRGTIVQDDLKYIDEEVFQKIKQYTISKNDIYITIAGTIGQVGEVPEFFDGMNLTENAAKLTFGKINKRYLLLTLSSETLQKQFLQKTNQMAQPKLALKRIADALFPLPPLAEQQRIVAKVDQLMALCDELESRLRESETHREKLMNAAVQHVLQAVSSAGKVDDVLIAAN